MPSNFAAAVDASSFKVSCSFRSISPDPVFRADSHAYASYFTKSAAPLYKYTDALVAELRRSDDESDQSAFAAGAATTTAAAAADRCSNSEARFYLNRLRRRRVTFADEVGLKLERVARLDCAGEWSDEEDTTSVANDNKNYCIIPRRYTICGNFTAPRCQRLTNQRAPSIHLTKLHLRRDATLVAIATVTLATNSRVFARVTDDNWQSYRDVEAHNLAPEASVCAIELLSRADRCDVKQRQLEFCLCLKWPDGSEAVWDNNRGRNYRLALPVIDQCPAAQ